MSNCHIDCENEPVKSFWICLHFHKCKSTNYHKATLCNNPHGSNSVVCSLLCQENNGNGCYKDLEMEICTLSNKDAHKLGEHAQCWNTLKNR